MREWVSLRIVCCAAIALVALAGCGGSGSASSSAAPPVAANKSVQISSGTSTQDTVTVGQTFTVTPKVTGANGQTLTFSVKNAASWMSFNSTTGVLSGTPAAADVGTYANIVLSVSDGQTSASAPPFSIVVAGANAATGSADVSWTPPTTNTDGSTLTNLAGYRIYYGTSSSALTEVVDISNIGVTDYVIGGLGTGTWYFAVKAYNSAGTESSLSNIATKTIT